MRAVVALERAGILVPKASAKIREAITAKYPKVTLSSSASQADELEDLDAELCDEDAELSPEEQALLGDL